MGSQSGGQKEEGEGRSPGGGGQVQGTRLSAESGDGKSTEQEEDIEERDGQTVPFKPLTFQRRKDVHTLSAMKQSSQSHPCFKLVFFRAKKQNNDNFTHPHYIGKRIQTFTSVDGLDASTENAGQYCRVQ